jgi:RNA polymerase sigma factor (sigma-70 family)
MRRSLLEAVIRHAGALATQSATSDAELLRRFADSRDEAAFAELVRRHGPMVWAVCRQSLVNAADAEDAFQATFLALVRSAGKVRAGAALGGWLHGVAVRVATKAKRSAVRRRQREQKAAGPEAGRPIPEAAWNELLAAVHEEVRRLPEALRTAFVLCELEGVRQPDAAARLGWKPGTLTGRLTKARQRLLEQLTKRGLVPTVASGATGLSAATASAVVPSSLFGKVMTFAEAVPGEVSPAVLELLREVTPMMLSRTKLLAAAVLAAGGLGIGVGAKVMSTAGAQPGGEGEVAAKPAPKKDRDARDGKDKAKSPPAKAGLMAGAAFPRERWEYQFDNSPKSVEELRKLVEKRGRDGWEFAGQVHFPRGGAGADVPPQLVFKRPHGWGKGFGMAFSGMDAGGMMRPGGMSPYGMPGMEMPGGGMGSGGKPGSMPGLFGGMGGGMPPGMSSPMGGPAMAPPRSKSKSAAGEYQVVGLKHASAMDFASMLQQLFPAVNVVGYSQTNSLILKADQETLREVEALIKKLDIPAPANTPGGAGGAGGPFAPGAGYPGGPGGPPVAPRPR